MDKEERLALARRQKFQNTLALLRPPPRLPSQAQRIGYSSTPRTRGAAVQGEMKYFDTIRTSTAVATVVDTWVAGTILDPTKTIVLSAAAEVANPLCLFAPTVGAGLNQRNGRNVNLMKIKLQGQVAIPNQTALAAPPNGTKVRILLVLDKQTNSAQMTSASLLNGSEDATTTINAYQNPNFFGRFQVLKEKIINTYNPAMSGVVAGPTIVVNGAVYSFKMNYNFNGLSVHFNNTSNGTVADIVNNSLHFIIGSNNISTIPSVAYYSRVSYKDP
jgi:hypothetical protein